MALCVGNVKYAVGEGKAGRFLKRGLTGPAVVPPGLARSGDRRYLMRATVDASNDGARIGNVDEVGIGRNPMRNSKLALFTDGVCPTRFACADQVSRSAFEVRNDNAIVARRARVRDFTAWTVGQLIDDVSLAAQGLADG